MADGVAAPLAAVSLLRRPLALVPCLVRLPATQRDESSRAASVQRQHISTAPQLESRQQDRCAAQSTHRFLMMTGVRKRKTPPLTFSQNWIVSVGLPLFRRLRRAPQDHDVMVDHLDVTAATSLSTTLRPFF